MGVSCVHYVVYSTIAVNLVRATQLCKMMVDITKVTKFLIGLSSLSIAKPWNSKTYKKITVLHTPWNRIAQ